jgi:glycosyltransferase involved in cell wall biosynthesis
VKIGFVNVGDFVGGAERELVDHAVAVKEDHGITILAIIDSGNTEFAALLHKYGIPVEAADFQLERNRGVTSSNFGNIWRVFEQARTLRAIQRRHALDIVVTYSFHSGIVGAIARLTGMRAKLVVGQVMRRDLNRGGLIEHLQFFAADGVTYNSNALRRSFADVAKRYSRPTKVVYSYVKKPVVEDRASARSQLAAEFGISPSTKLVCYCGHIFKSKRVEDAVEAVSLLNANARGDFFLVAIGGSSAPADYETEVRALAAAKCPGRHHFFPFVSDPFPLMAACDVLAMPSIEPFGRVVVEAMYLGVPFVATDAAGPREIMTFADPRCGELVPPMRPDLIADAVFAITQNRLLEFPPVPHILTREGIVAGAVQFYEEVLARKRWPDGQIRDFGLLHGGRTGG